ncbi:RimK family alpha-L-glutamate ligase [Sporolactobacillus sp. THM19-2]|nr:RimK family alpha-L-glutamate ligase [Sporolactobacillus sp. THM19-2]
MSIMKYGWIVYSESVVHNRYGNNAFDWMKEEAGTHHIDLAVIFIEQLVIDMGQEQVFYYQGRKLQKPDFVVMRCYNRIVGSQLEQSGIRVINKTLAMFQARNKVVTAQILNRAGIPTPGMIYMMEKNYPFLRKQFDGKPFVMKAVEGSQGKNVFLVRNESDFDEAWSKTQGYFLCQEFINKSFGKDLRVYVLGGRVLGSVLRKSVSGFRANYALGGHAALYKTTEEMISLCTRTAKVLNLEFCGIDLLFTEDGLTVCEVNGNAGFRTISKVSDVDIPRELFNYVATSVYHEVHEPTVQK